MATSTNQRLEEFLATDLTGKDKKLIEIQKILKRENTPLGRLMDEPCEECNQQEVYCGHADLGAVDYYDNFWHICLNPDCLDHRHREIYSCVGSESKGDMDCPFCKYER